MSSKNKFLINSKKLEANILVKVCMREKNSSTGGSIQII